MSMDIDATESLQFDLPIVPRSGSRSIPVDELKRRLEVSVAVRFLSENKA